MEIKNIKTKFFSLLLLILMLLGTGFAYSYIRKNIQQQGRVKFESQSQAVANAISVRFNRDAYFLYSLRGLYAASKTVERNEFKAFGDGSQLTKNFPGIYGIEFVEKVTAENKDAFIENVKNDTSLRPEGYPEFKIYPEEKKDNYFTLKYFYPDEKELSFMGFDFLTEKNRYEALEEAIKTDSPTITKRVKIIGSNEAAFIILLPIYKNGYPSSTEAERRENLDGYVGAVIEVEKFFDSVLQSEKIDWNGIDLYVYDQAPNSGINTENFLYDVDKEEADEDKAEWAYFYDLPLKIAGKTWTLHFVADPDYGINNLEFAMTGILVLFGVIFSFVVSGSFFFLGTSRSRALSLAAEMTIKLRESEEKFRTILDNVDIGIYRNTLKDGGTFLEANPAMLKIFGFDSKDEFMKLKTADLYLSKDERKPVVKQLQNEGAVNDVELRLKKKDGKIIWVSLTARVHRDEKGNIDWVDGAMKDITDQKEIADKEKTRNDEIKRMNTLMVDRELKMIELKKQVEKFKKQKSA